MGSPSSVSHCSKLIKPLIYSQLVSMGHDLGLRVASEIEDNLVGLSPWLTESASVRELLIGYEGSPSPQPAHMLELGARDTVSIAQGNSFSHEATYFPKISFAPNFMTQTNFHPL